MPSIAAASTIAVAAAASSVSSIQPSPTAGTGAGGSWCSSVRPAGGHRRERVDLGLEVEERAQELAPRCLVAEVRGLDDHDLAAAERRRHLRDRRKLQQATDRGHLLGDGARPVGPRGEHLARAVHRPDEPAGERLGDGVERDLDRRDDAEAAAAAPERPEEVRVRLGVGPHDLAVGGDDLGGEHARRREAVLPGKPADAAAERVADDPDVLRRAVERGEAVLDGGVDDVDPDRPRRDGRHPGARVDLDAGHPGGVDQKGAVEEVVPGAVAGALHGDPEADGARVVDGRDDVVDGLGEGDRGGPLVDGEVPGAARLVVAGVPGEAEDVGGGCGACGASGVDELRHVLRLLSASMSAVSIPAARARRRCGSPNRARGSTAVLTCGQPASSAAASAVRRAASRRATSTEPASSRSVWQRTSAGRCARSASPATTCDGHVERAALAEDVTDDLPGERGRVEAPLAREDERRAGERLAEPDDVGDELRPRDEAGAERRQAAGEPARRARAGQLADVDAVVGPVALGELRQPALQLRDGGRVGSLLRAEDRGCVDEPGRHIACDDDLRAAKVEVERLERPEPAVDGRRSADRDEDAADALVERGADQLARPDRRRAQRVVRSRDEGEAARAGHLDHRGVAAHAPLRVDRRSERPGDTGRPAVGCLRAEDVERALAAVRERQPERRAADPLDPLGERCRGLPRAEAATELVRAAENRAVDRHAARISRLAEPALRSRRRAPRKRTAMGVSITC